jgi:hypothetical protein
MIGTALIILGDIVLALLLVGGGIWLIFRSDYRTRAEDEEVLKLVEQWREGK